MQCRNENWLISIILSFALFFGVWLMRSHHWFRAKPLSKYLNRPSSATHISTELIEPLATFLILQEYLVHIMDPIDKLQCHRRLCSGTPVNMIYHDDVIEWKHFSSYWPFVRGIHRSPADSPHRGQWHGALFSLMCAWTNGWANHRDPGDLISHGAHCDVIVM